MKQDVRSLPTVRQLQEHARSLDGRGYKAYKDVTGGYQAAGLTLHVDHVQGDPFAEPSRFRAVVDPGHAGLLPDTYASRDRRRATADFFNRVLASTLAGASVTVGSGTSGMLRVLTPGQQVLERASVVVDDTGGIVARFRVGLPARGRRILGDAAARLVATVLEALDGALRLAAVDALELRRHIEAVEDAVALRDQLEPRGLVAFVADGAILPRRSGIDDRPLVGERVVPFRSPEDLRVVLDTPNAGPLAGMGIPTGVTLIVGGGFHGKSTLLEALQAGVYDHAAEDGRERVVTARDAIKVRAEDGRSVAGTDISNFIGSLPSAADTRRFVTENASGSTSQAAAIIEGLEAGATTLLMDEDTSATNFMIRDARMQRLIAPEDEPITPFIDRALSLHRDAGVSTVMVVGGSGDYFDVATTVIAMKEYAPIHVTEAARQVARELPTGREPRADPWRLPARRCPIPESIRPGRGRRPLSIRPASRDRIEFGLQTVDLGAVEQIVETAQTRAIAHAVAAAADSDPGGREDVAAFLDGIVRRIALDGLVSVHPHGIGELAEFRRIELAAFLNRLRGLRTRPEVGE